MKYTTTLEAAMGKICQAALLLIRHSLTRIQPKYRTPKSIHTQLAFHLGALLLVWALIQRS